MTEGTRWHAWHLHLLALGPQAGDRVVHHVLGPAVDTLRHMGPGAAWFFVRYWRNGPHVRFRVAGLADHQECDLDALLRARMTEVLDAMPQLLTSEEYQRHAAALAAAGEGFGPLDPGGLWPAGVYRQRYQPEVERYGGADLLGRSEALFGDSSELALSFARLEPPEAARSGLGLRATHAALMALGADARRRFCRRASADWEAWSEGGGLGKSPLPRALTAPAGPAPAPVGRWANRLSEEMAVWRGALGEETAVRILHAHIHMLHNRLGLSVAQECSHYMALAEMDLAVTR